MKKCYLVLFLTLAACSGKPPNPSKFACITPFGNVQFEEDDPRVSLQRYSVTLHQDSEDIVFSRSLCAEVKSK